jgi:trans-2,3-dihydro-3-hydroxyanthranilate isomerase
LPVDRERYFELVESTEAKNIFVFCPRPYEEADLAARMYGDYYGVHENRATGSATGYLAGYLVEHRYFGENSSTSGSSRGTRSDALLRCIYRRGKKKAR